MCIFGLCAQQGPESLNQKQGQLAKVLNNTATASHGKKLNQMLPAVPDSAKKIKKVKSRFSFRLSKKTGEILADQKNFRAVQVTIYLKKRIVPRWTPTSQLIIRQVDYLLVVIFVHLSPMNNILSSLQQFFVWKKYNSGPNWGICEIFHRVQNQT